MEVTLFVILLAPILLAAIFLIATGRIPVPVVVIVITLIFVVNIGLSAPYF